MTHLLKSFFRSKKQKQPESTDYMNEEEPHRRSTRDRDRHNVDILDMHPSAPYHKLTAPKLSRGPKSCPGGGDSFARPYLHNDPCYMDYPRHKQHKQRGFSSSSEYGSGDPSPTLRTQLHHYLDLDDSDEQPVVQSRQELKQMAFVLRMKLQEDREKRYKLKRAFKEERDVLQRQMNEYQKHIGKLNDMLIRERQEKATLQKKLDLLDKQRQFDVLTSSMHHQQPSGVSLLAPYPLLSNTSSSPIGTIGSHRGAGEALCNVFASYENEEDEVRLFRGTMETARADDSSSLVSMPVTRNGSLLREDDGYSTTTTVQEEKRSSSSIKIPRRSSSYPCSINQKP